MHEDEELDDPGSTEGATVFLAFLAGTADSGTPSTVDLHIEEWCCSWSLAVLVRCSPSRTCGCCWPSCLAVVLLFVVVGFMEGSLVSLACAVLFYAGIYFTAYL